MQVVSCSVGFARFKIDNFSVRFHLHFPFTSGLSPLWPRTKKINYSGMLIRAVLNHLLGKFLTKMIGWDSSNLCPNEVIPDFFFMETASLRFISRSERIQDIKPTKLIVLRWQIHS